MDQNFDSYSVEYTFADGTKIYLDGRTWRAARTFIPATCTAAKAWRSLPSRAIAGNPPAYYKGQRPTADMIWESKVNPEEKDPYQNEWNDLVDAIRDDKPYNEVPRGVEASLVSTMGRMAAHTGQEITYDEMLNYEHEMRRAWTSSQWIPRLHSSLMPTADIPCRSRAS